MQSVLVALIVVTTTVVPLLLLVLGFIVRKYKNAVPCPRKHFAPEPCLQEHFAPEPARAFDQRDLPLTFRRYLPQPPLLFDIRASIRRIDWQLAYIFNWQSSDVMENPRPIDGPTGVGSRQSYGGWTSAPR
ncbi:hypothetical protein MMC17_004541 [Xylographa soralifera]|nr:hypothetical protein [Xylographa soralifera]